jgi:CRISPR system Cascade subunit CasE
MYLTRIVVDAHDRKVQRALEDPYRLHQAILAAFPSGAGNPRGRVLFRVEPEVRGRGVVVLIQSEIAPGWGDSAVAERLTLLSADPPKALPASLEKGQAFRFRLRANPTRRSQTRRLAVVGIEAQTAWLRRKLEGAGFELVTARVVDEGVRRGRKPGREEGNMVFASVLFDGILRVSAGDRALEALRGGVGSAKAFGFGLISLARA